MDFTSPTKFFEVGNWLLLFPTADELPAVFMAVNDVHPATQAGWRVCGLACPE